MKGKSDNSRRQPSPSFPKTSREWILSSALYDGIEDEDIRQIELLLSERGANPNTLLPEYGIAPFHMVVANESTRFAVQATDICLQHGADPNVRSEEGLTPVHLATMWGCPEVLQVLLASGGNPWLVDCFNKNAFDYALEEEQGECYSILKTSCNSQPKPSSHSKSPYQLNLKRVVLYKNDLQIVYEALPSQSQKCVSTQTSPTAFQDTCKKNAHNTDVLNNIPTTSQIDRSCAKAVHEKDACYFFSKSSIQESNNLQNKVKTASPITPHESMLLSSKLKEVINNHRRNSTVFEYSPRVNGIGNLNNGVNSRKDDVENGGVVSGTASALINQLETANKLRQTLMSNDKKSGLLKNVTQRKKPNPRLESYSSNNGLPCERSLQFSPTPNEIANAINRLKSGGDSPSSISMNSPELSPQHDIGFVLNNFPKCNGSSKNQPYQNESSPNEIGFVLSKFNSFPNGENEKLPTINQSSQYSPPLNEIGFVLSDTLGDSSILSRRNKAIPAENPQSPPSIGFILDNLDETASETRGSSLFSDIDSNIEVCTSPGKNFHSEDVLITEDESSSDNRQDTKRSSSDSLNPYVSCNNGDTRECSTRECFESCVETLSSDNCETPLKVDSDDTVPELDDVNSVSESVLMAAEDGSGAKTTPRNPNLITSTPERKRSGSDEFSFTATATSNAEPEKRKWVEATLPSSSDSDHDPYLSISEEYEYTDVDEGVKLIERRYLKNDIQVSDHEKLNHKPHMPSSGSEESEASTISQSEGAYDTDELRRALSGHGLVPGPINRNTKRVYLRQLKRYRHRPAPLLQVDQPGEILSSVDCPYPYHILMLMLYDSTTFN